MLLLVMLVATAHADKTHLGTHDTLEATGVVSIQDIPGFDVARGRYAQAAVDCVVGHMSRARRHTLHAADKTVLARCPEFADAHARFATVVDDVTLALLGGVDALLSTTPTIEPPFVDCVHVDYGVNVEMKNPTDISLMHPLVVFTSAPQWLTDCHHGASVVDDNTCDWVVPSNNYGGHRWHRPPLVSDAWTALWQPRFVPLAVQQHREPRDDATAMLWRVTIERHVFRWTRVTKDQRRRLGNQSDSTTTGSSTVDDGAATNTSSPVRTLLETTAPPTTRLTNGATTPAPGKSNETQPPTPNVTTPPPTPITTTKKVTTPSPTPSPTPAPT
ncbi:hypothetical protein As57867_003706, partial [Aphanomyces stellatus]